MGQAFLLTLVVLKQASLGTEPNQQGKVDVVVLQVRVNLIQVIRCECVIVSRLRGYRGTHLFSFRERELKAMMVKPSVLAHAIMI
jgi:hypothetical protein